MVEQFGFAIIPLCFLMASLFTSGTTSGIFGSILKALLLSITTAPDLTAFGAKSRLLEAPAEKRAMLIPLKESSVNLFTLVFFPLNSIYFPSDLSDANSFKLPTGKFLSSRIDTISLPTAPVAPTTATVYLFFIFQFLSYQSPHLLCPDKPFLIFMYILCPVALVKYIQNCIIYIRGCFF